jgi:hypothetical protein
VRIVAVALLLLAAGCNCGGPQTKAVPMTEWGKPHLLLTDFPEPLQSREVEGVVFPGIHIGEGVYPNCWIDKLTLKLNGEQVWDGLSGGQGYEAGNSCTDLKVFQICQAGRAYGCTPIEWTWPAGYRSGPLELELTDGITTLSAKFPPLLDRRAPLVVGQSSQSAWKQNSRLRIEWNVPTDRAELTLTPDPFSDFAQHWLSGGMVDGGYEVTLPDAGYDGKMTLGAALTPEPLSCVGFESCGAAAGLFFELPVRIEP